MKRTWFRRGLGGGAAVVALSFGTGALAHETMSPKVRQVSPTAVVAKGANLDVVLSYRFARDNRDTNWLMLDALMTADSPVGVPRSAISVRTPSGEVVPLATQREFERSFPQTMWAVTVDRRLMEPIGYLAPQRVRPLRYFAARGVGIAWDVAYLDEFHNSFGRLFFHLPEGVQKGRYELRIDVPKSPITIPFTL
jgi:hypothetical protein